ncbi:MAG: ferrous iron transport protein A [Methylacidiphilales bacterium]|nr:ferrous iron transport protein A [Candidatus Methylacidiphilales bacterium]
MPPAPSLDDIRPGETCRIVALHGGGTVRRRLLDMGIVPGVRVEVIRNAPLRDPIEIRVHNTFMTLRRIEASRIEVVLVADHLAAS